MLPSSPLDESLVEQLPKVRGRYQFHVPLNQLTWFGVGGAADVIFKPKDQEDLRTFVQKNTLPVFVLGAGSNIIVRDKGIRGVVIRLSGSFSEILHNEAENVLEVGAGCLDRTLALTCQKLGIAGFEFFIGIPGTIGGALRMNAGAYGTETADLIEWVEVMNPKGEIFRLSVQEIGFGYRQCKIPQDWIFLKAGFKVVHDSPQAIQQKIQHILSLKQDSQPVKGKTGGSTFKNPEGMVAWKLIDEAGLRGFRIGDAVISEKHCNFMINLGQATAQNLEMLGETVIKTVKEKCHVTLIWEIIRVGEM